MRKTVLGAIALACAAGIALPAVAATTKKVSFLTNYVFNGRHAPFFVGVEKGFYKAAGFDVQIAPASGSGFVVTAVEAGKADYGMAESSSVVQAIAKGAKVKGFMVYMDVTTSGLASLKPYKTPKSIEGKKVAAAQTDSARVIVPIIFDMRHLDPKTIDWVSADPSVYFSLLLSGQVDLITASSDGDVPALSKLAVKEGKTVDFASFADWGYDVFGYFLVTSDKSLTSDKGDAEKFAAATVKAVDYSIKHPEEAARIMVKYNPTMNYDTTLTQWKKSIGAFETAYVKKHGYGAATNDRLQRTIDLVKKALKLETKLTPAEVYTDVLPTH